MIYINILWVVLPITFNFIFIKYKSKRTNKILREKLEEKGYKIDRRFKNTLFKELVKKYCKDYFLELGLISWCPFLSLCDLYFNFKYLQGDYSGINYFYAEIEDIIDEENAIKYLKRLKLIKEDKEKLQFVKDKDDSLKKLMYKYDEMDTNLKEEKNSTLNSEDIVFSKKDSLNELNEKLKQMQQLIKEKENEIPSDSKKYVYKPENKK